MAVSVFTNVPVSTVEDRDEMVHPTHAARFQSGESARAYRGVRPSGQSLALATVQVHTRSRAFAKGCRRRQVRREGQAKTQLSRGCKESGHPCQALTRPRRGWSSPAADARRRSVGGPRKVSTVSVCRSGCEGQRRCNGQMFSV